MKKCLSVFLSFVLILSLCACGSTSQDTGNENEQGASTQEPDKSTPNTENDNDSDIALTDLKQGDEVSIIGQKANATLVNENTIWLQVQQKDGTFIIYHCQLKDEYLSAAGELKMLDIVKVRGCFFSYTDMQQENTSPLVTLYDCELIME